MKKILTLLVAVLVTATTISAKEYKHSLGMVGGFGIGVQYKTLVKPDFTIIVEEAYSFCPTRTANVGGYQAWVTDCVLAYQANITEGQGIKLDWFLGGQVKLGYVFDNAGLIGLGAAGGIEANMTNAPIAFSFDFRPGYGCMLADDGMGGIFAGHIFDYTLNLGVRYTF